MNIALVLAGGKGTRMGADVPKQYIEYNNKPMLVHTLEAIADVSAIDKICVICPADSIEYAKTLVEICEENGLRLISKEEFNTKENLIHTVCVFEK